MNVEELKQAIVHVAMRHAPAAHGRVLVYAELRDGELSSALAFERGGPAGMVFDDEVVDLRHLVRELWEQWHRTPAREPWSVLACVVDGDRVEFDFSSPVQVQAHVEQRLLELAGHTGDTEFDVEALDA